MKSLLKVSTLLAFASPFIALADVTAVDPSSAATNVQGLGSNIASILTTIGTILIAVAFVVFLWGIVQYILAGADEEKRATARNLIIYGIIGLFVMIAVWGVVYLLANVLGVTVGGAPGAGQLPGAPGDTSVTVPPTGNN